MTSLLENMMLCTNDTAQNRSFLRTKYDAMERGNGLWSEDQDIDVAIGVLAWCFECGLDDFKMLLEQGGRGGENLSVDFWWHSRCRERWGEVPKRLATHDGR